MNTFIQKWNFSFLTQVMVNNTLSELTGVSVDPPHSVQVFTLGNFFIKFCHPLSAAHVQQPTAPPLQTNMMVFDPQAVGDHRPVIIKGADLSGLLLQVPWLPHQYLFYTLYFLLRLLRGFETEQKFCFTRLYWIKGSYLCI